MVVIRIVNFGSIYYLKRFTPDGCLTTKFAEGAKKFKTQKEAEIAYKKKFDGDRIKHNVPAYEEKPNALITAYTLITQ
jgi:hypothetical protein